MFEVKNRTVESWGPLADLDQEDFDKLLRGYCAGDSVKHFIKKQKSLKKFRVTFKKEWHSDKFILKAASESDLHSVARQYFTKNRDKIGFKEPHRGNEYPGYDSLSYVKVI